MNMRYSTLSITVDSVAAQRYIAQMLRGEMAGAPVCDFNTGRGKDSRQFRAEAIAVEFSRGQWEIRGSDTSEVAALIKDMLSYSLTQR